jgi:tartrate dehydrogenase/decarboxylase/D-malate dehydrogenase
MKTFRLAIVPGDGIGHEIIPAALKVLEAAGKKFDFELEYTFYDWGAGRYLKEGAFMPENGLETLKSYNAVFFGAVGLPDVDDTLPAKLYTFKVRTAFQQYVNFRPVKLFKGLESPLRSKTTEDIDFIVIRENNEGEFVQSGAFFRPESPEGLATDTSIFTRKGIERVAHYAFKLAQKRRKKVTNVTKSNTLIHSLKYWDTVIAEVSEQYPDVTLNKMYIDNASANFILHPEYFDVILTTNLFGDILSDLGGGIMGSLGLGGSGNINPEGDFPSMFEPIHGSAPDIAGKGIANPVGTIWSGALLLENLGEKEAAAQIVHAIETVFQEGVKTIDLGGSAKTNEFAERVINALNQ